MVERGSRPGPDHLKINFSNIRGHEMSLVRRFRAVMLWKMTGEAQGRGWKGFWGLERITKIHKSDLYSENPKIPLRENLGFPNWALGFVPIIGWFSKGHSEALVSTATN